MKDKDDLKTYEEKRDFHVSPEPKGGKHSQEHSQLIFVIQKHDASHLHYDLRLEYNGVLKSWAIPKGPSLNPKDKRLAVETEDHPFEYKDFEGIIPAKQYGAGTVLIWDRGTYELSNQVSSFISQYNKGHIKIILNGTKLKGGFVLQRIRREKKNLWILIKEKDAFQDLKNDITLENKSVVTFRTLKEINQDARHD
jgi:bifunctional non-homologous end joining protein LigD